MFRTECIISLHKFGPLVALIRQNPGSQGMIQAMQPASRSVDPPSQSLVSMKKNVVALLLFDSVDAKENFVCSKECRS